MRGVAVAAPGTTIGGDIEMPSGTEPNERMVLSVGLSSPGGRVRSTIAISLGLRKNPAASGPAAEK